MRIVWDTTRSRFVLECQFKEADLARNGGFVEDRDSRTWWAKDPFVVLSAKGTPGLTITPEAKAILGSDLYQAELSIRGSRALDADVDVPVPDGLSYFPFQKAGVKYALSRKDTLIGCEMGVGKTIQAIGVSNADSLCHRVLIVCPAFLKDNWLKEWTRWDVKHLSTGVVRTGQSISKSKTIGGVKTKVVEEVQFPSSDVVIINYELLEDWRQEIRNIEFDLAIFDECHFLKNKKADRTKEVFGCRAGAGQKHIEPIRARRRLFLSGTPILNKPRELWPLLRSVDPTGLGRDQMYFERRYCDGKMMPMISKSKLLLNGEPVIPPEDTSSLRKFWSAVGATNSDELQNRLRSTFMIRRLRADVLPMLPKKRRQVILVEGKGVSTLLERERKTYEAYGVDLEDVDLDSPEFSKISEVRKEIGIKKIPFIIDRMREALNETEKIVVFVHHHEVVDGIYDIFGDMCAVVDGRIPNDDRQFRVDRFQSSPDCRVFLGTIGAAGIGFTLTAAWLAIFGESAWRPSDLSQAEDRLARIGQVHPVLIQHIILKGSLDERQIQLVIAKQEMADKSLDNIQEAA